MTPAALTQFNNQRLNAQYSVFGKPVKLNNVDGVGCFNAPDFSEMLVEGGRQVMFENVVRLRASDWPTYTTAESFKSVFIELSIYGVWHKFHIRNSMPIELGGEWKLSLELAVN